MSTVKEEAKRLIDRLPNEATWEDVIYEMYVRNKVERGLKDVAEGRTVLHEEVRKRFSRS